VTLDPVLIFPLPLRERIKVRGIKNLFQIHCKKTPKQLHRCRMEVMVCAKKPPVGKF
jgi:hypothetical protein